MRARPAGAAVLLIAVALSLAACGSSAPRSGAPPWPGAARTGSAITISNFMFRPMSLTVSPGATVSVTNQDSTTHTLTATGHQFDTGDIGQHQTKTFKAPTRPGTYHYICNIHEYMMGTITVR